MRPSFLNPMLTVALAAVFTTAPAHAGAQSSRIFHVPLPPAPAAFVAFTTQTEIGWKIDLVTLEVTYDNRGTGSDAAYASWTLSRLSGGGSWRVRGRDLGWSGEGVFSAVLGTDSLNGPIEGLLFWETLNTGGPFGATTEGRFSIHARGAHDQGPFHPQP